MSVEHLGELRLRLTFSAALVRDLDFAGTLEGGVLEPLNDPALFGQVAVDEVVGTIAWPNGVDFDPDFLHGDHEPARGVPPALLGEQRLRAVG